MKEPMDPPEDRRQQPRLPFDVQVEIRTPDHTVRGTTRDISMFGLFVQSADLLPLDTLCEVEVVLSLDKQEQSIKGQVQVVRHVEDPQTGVRGMGFRFIGLDEA